MNAKINGKQKSGDRTSNGRRSMKINSWQTARRSLLTKCFADKISCYTLAKNRDWSAIIIEPGSLAVIPTHFCRFRPEVWLFTDSQRYAVLSSDSFPFAFCHGSASYSWFRSTLDKAVDRMLCQRISFLPTNVWERVNEHGYRWNGCSGTFPVKAQEQNWQREEEARKSQVCRDRNLRRC